jgi:hypothetical protein
MFNSTSRAVVPAVSIVVAAGALSPPLGAAWAQTRAAANSPTEASPATAAKPAAEANPPDEAQSGDESKAPDEVKPGATTKPAAQSKPTLTIDEAEEFLRTTPSGKESLAKLQQEKKDREAILEKHFGAGIFANFDLGKSPRIRSARVVNGVVRIEEDSRAQAGFFLEAHKFLFPPIDTRKFAHGPFAGAIVNSTNGFDALALGWMVGFYTRGGANNLDTLNLGIGLSVTPRAQVLGDGIKPNEPLPSGETEIRYKYKTIYGFLISMSFGF